MRLVAAVCAGASLLVLWPEPRWSTAIRLGQPLGHRWIAVVGGCLVAALLARATPAVMILAGFAAATGVAVAGEVVRDRGRRRRVRQAVATAEALDVLAAELSAGTAPERAVVAVADDHPWLQPVLARSDVAAGLAALATAPGRDALADLAAAWRVSARSGAPLAALLQRVADGTRASVEVLREVEAAVAPARATAQIMAVLPLLALALGAGLGASPLVVMVSTPLVAASVGVGCLLAAAGVVWIGRITDRAMESA